MHPKLFHVFPGSRLWGLFWSCALIYAVGCAKRTSRRQPSEARSAAEGQTGVGLSPEEGLSTVQLREEIQGTHARLNALELKFGEYAFLSAELCEKKQQMDASCPLAVPISSSGSAAAQSCEGEETSPVRGEPLKVKITGLKGSFKIRFDGAYESQPLVAGQESELRVTQVSGSGKLVPRFRDVQQVELISLAGHVEGSGELRIWNTRHPSIFTAKLAFAKRTSIQVGDPVWSALALSVDCTLNQESYLQFLQQTRAAYHNRGQETVQTPLNDGQELPKKVKELQQVLTDLGARLAAAQAQIEYHQDIISKLRTQLIQGQNHGCWLAKPIRDLQIVVDGDFAGTEVIREKSSTQNTFDAGSPGTLEVDLGGFKITTDAPGKIPVAQDLSDKTIAQISALRLRKLGHAFESVRIPCTSSVLKQLDNQLFDDNGNECYKISEVRQMRIRKLTVSVYGGLKLFEQSFAPAIMLTRKSKKGPYLDLLNDPHWISMLYKSDCETDG